MGAQPVVGGVVLTTAQSWATLALLVGLVVAALIAGYLIAHPAIVCTECDAVFRHAPVMDEYDWRPASQRATYCTRSCLDNAAERAGTAYLNQGRY